MHIIAMVLNNAQMDKQLERLVSSRALNGMGY